MWNIPLKKCRNVGVFVGKSVYLCWKGETYIVRKFAKENYESVVYMNFILEPSVKSAFTGNIDVDTIILNLSALIPDCRFLEGRTCIVLDEIQECKEARTALKSFHIDGRFDVIATGSLLGVKGYGKSKKVQEGQDSVPVGYETVVDMYPLDFEEFLWANGISGRVIDSVKSCFENETVVPDGIHKAMMDLLYRYVIVGGLPDVVNCFLETKNIELIYKMQRNLLAEYEEDFLCKSGQKLYYFHKDSGLELDFLVRFKGECVILEVKAHTGKAKSMITVLKNKNVYHVKSAIKLGHYNVGREGELLTLPLYMGFLLEDRIEDSIIPDIDLSSLTVI